MALDGGAFDVCMCRYGRQKPHFNNCSISRSTIVDNGDGFMNHECLNG